MPLIKSGAKSAISQNIREMIAAGHPQKQAVAAALSTARKYADGGSLGHPRFKAPNYNRWEDLPESSNIEDRREERPFQKYKDNFVQGMTAGWTWPEFKEALNAPMTPYRELPSVLAARQRDQAAAREMLETSELARSLGPDYPTRTMRGPRATGGRVYADGGITKHPEIRKQLWLNAGPFSEHVEDRREDVPFDESSSLRRDLGYYDMKRPVPMPRPKPRNFAAGGYSGGSPWQERAASRAITHAGMLKSNVPGRTDKLPITVGGGAFVVPADHLAALGQGNSQAGAAILNGMFGLGGNKKGSVAKAMRPSIPKLKKKIATGGDAGESSEPVDIIAAGGEFIVPPEKVREIGGGDLDQGHKILHRWVLQTRKQHIKTLKGLKPPKT